MCVFRERKTRDALPILGSLGFCLSRGLSNLFLPYCMARKGRAGSVHVCSRGAEDTASNSYLSFGLVFCLSHLFLPYCKARKGRAVCVHVCSWRAEETG